MLAAGGAQGAGSFRAHRVQHGVQVQLGVQAGGGACQGFGAGRVLPHLFLNGPVNFMQVPQALFGTT